MNLKKCSDWKGINSHNAVLGHAGRGTAALPVLMLSMLPLAILQCHNSKWAGCGISLSLFLSLSCLFLVTLARPQANKRPQVPGSGNESGQAI